jgi:hypothetical protein
VNVALAISKTCTKCLVEKPVTDFRVNARYADGRITWCSDCCKAYRAAHAVANADRRKAQGRAYYLANKAACNARSAENYADNKEAYAVRTRAAKRRKPELYRDLARQYQRRRRAVDVEWRLRSRLSAQLNYCLKTGKGGKTTEATVGYSIAELRTHLERQFTKGMGWDNMGEWHIDHIVPLASFTITGPNDPELRRAWSLPNLRPIWAAENLAKHHKRVTLL